MSSNSDLTIDSTTFENYLFSGILAVNGSSLLISYSKIINNQKNGVFIQDNISKVTFDTHNMISQNQQCGIHNTGMVFLGPIMAENKSYYNS
ncbi:MAG: right-handed parallel beta-helix repeat-containing protein, partial [Candidatus Marinimicrobia bacterium]|nr:right-handed parallel beta-helix repeat-containing protein [Candidatus Neomarinimicrobiota bacterium]